MQHIFIVNIDGKEIDMSVMQKEEKETTTAELVRNYVEYFGYQREKTAYAVPVGRAKEG